MSALKRAASILADEITGPNPSSQFDVELPEHVLGPLRKTLLALAKSEWENGELYEGKAIVLKGLEENRDSGWIADQVFRAMLRAIASDL